MRMLVSILQPRRKSTAVFCWVLENGEIDILLNRGIVDKILCMKNSKPVLVDTNEILKIVQNLQTGFIIVGGPAKKAYGTVPRMDTLFVWTSREKAEAFIKDNNLNPNDDKIIEEPFDVLCSKAIGLGFTNLRFDFTAAGTHPDQKFLNMRLPKEVANMSIAELLKIFNDI